MFLKYPCFYHYLPTHIYSKIDAALKCNSLSLAERFGNLIRIREEMRIWNRLWSFGTRLNLVYLQDHRPNFYISSTRHNARRSPCAVNCGNRAAALIPWHNNNWLKSSSYTHKDNHFPSIFKMDILIWFIWLGKKAWKSLSLTQWSPGSKLHRLCNMAKVCYFKN